MPPLVRAASEWAWRSIVIGVAAIAFLYLLGFLSDFAIKRVAAHVLRWQRGSTLQAKEG